MDAAMNAANRAFDTVDEFVQQLSSMDSLHGVAEKMDDAVADAADVINDTVTDEIDVEEILERMQQSGKKIL